MNCTIKSLLDKKVSSARDIRRLTRYIFSDVKDPLGRFSLGVLRDNVRERKLRERKVSDRFGTEDDDRRSCVCNL